MPRRKITPPGLRFTRLITTSDWKQHRYGASEDRWLLRCLCDCGKDVWLRPDKLFNGESKSCGCYSRDMTIKRSFKHGFAPRGQWKRTYNAWTSMVDRCSNPNRIQAKDYIGRGITLCDRWRDFRNFLEDMGECPPGLTIDRINNNGNYEPGNCRWVTRRANNQNKRSNIILSAFGITACMTELSRQFDIPNITVWQRIQAGAHPECALDKTQWITKRHIESCQKCQSITKTPGTQLAQSPRPRASKA